MKKLISLLLLICIAVLAASCENVEYIDRTSSEEESKGVYEELDEILPPAETDENGEVKRRKFTIVTNDKTVFYNEEDVSGIVDKAVEDRNDFLFDKYGAEIVAKEVDPSKVATELKTALEAGVQYCDMLCLPAKTTVKLYTSGLLYDMNALPNFDVGSAYFDERNAKSLATNSTLYLLPDTTAQIYDEINILYFNRELVNETAQKDPESLVMQGKWTWDSFNEICRAAAPTVYNKSSADIALDTFGFGAYYGEGVYPLAVWASTGEKVVGNTYKNQVGLSLTTAYMTEVCGKLVKSYNTRGRFPLEANEAMKAFTSGRLAFFSNKLSYFYALRDGTKKGSEYGILPMPKLSETQNGYYSLVGNDARVISVPMSLVSADDSRKRFVSSVIQATCAAGRKTIRDAYIAKYVVQYLNNNTETVMLQSIVDSAVFDFAYVYASGISEIRRTTIDALADYIEFGSSINSSVNRTIDAFNKYCEKNFG